MNTGHRRGLTSSFSRFRSTLFNRNLRQRLTAEPVRRTSPTCAAEPLERRVLLSSDIPNLVLVKDINDTSVGANPAPADSETADNFSDLTSTGNGKVFFTADRTPVGRELWVTDGTQAGTHLVKDIAPGIATSLPLHLTNVGGTLFFFANDGVHGFEPWKSDGTEAGTVMVKDVVPGLIGSNEQFLGDDPHPYFSSIALPGVWLYTTTSHKELWRTDGTAEGTYRLKEAGAIDDAHLGLQNQDIDPIWSANGLGYFTGSDPVVGRELWVTDGTVAGTKLLKDLMPGKAWSRAGSVYAGANGITYFTAITGGDPGNPVYSLFRTDGTTAGTQKVFDGPEHLNNVLAYNGFTYFTPQFPGVQPTQVWRTDGTPQGTVKVIEFPKPDSDFVNVASVFITGTFHGQMLLYGYKPDTGFEYYLTDGTQAALRPLMENPGPVGTKMQSLQVINDQLYFFMGDPATGAEPYRSDGTPEGTVLLKDIVPGAGSSFAFGKFLPASNGKVVFPAYPREPVTIGNNPTKPGGMVTYRFFALYAADGRPGGVERLAVVPTVPPMHPETESSIYQPFVFSGNDFFFAAVDAQLRDALWKTDGTPAGTVPVTYRVGKISTLMDLHGTLLFFGTGSDHVEGLWRSDGTEAGTVRVAPMQENVPDTGRPDDYRAIVGDTLYFVNGSSVWKTDGTAAGTVEVATFAPSAASAGPLHLTPGNGKVFFDAWDSAHGVELWATDGTPAGTAMVKDINPGPDPAHVDLLTAAANGTAYFRAYSPETGPEVWKSDGTAAGTVVVKDVNPGPGSEFGTGPYSIVAIGNHVYFAENSDSEPGKLMRTDGTAAGTVQVEPTRVFGPSGLRAADGKLYFYARKTSDPYASSVNYVLDDATGTLTELPRTPPAPALIGIEGFGVTGDNGVVMYGLAMGPYGYEPWVDASTLPGPRTGSVAGRHVYYDNSYYDSFHPGSDSKDNPAVATDKRALLPGQTASFANVTSYTRGINGIMVDLSGLPAGGTLSADDFIIRTGAGPSPAGMAAGPSHPAVSIRRGRGDGGADRVALNWPDGAIRNEWLQVTVKANDRTGLAKPDVFYFGNLVGETGDAASPLRVSAQDLAGVKRALTTSVRPVTNNFDFDRNGKVNAQDLAAVKTNYFRTLSPFTAPVAPTAAAARGDDDGATSLLRGG